MTVVSLIKTLAIASILLLSGWGIAIAAQLLSAASDIGVGLGLLMAIAIVWSTIKSTMTILKIGKKEDKDCSCSKCE